MRAASHLLEEVMSFSMRLAKTWAFSDELPCTAPDRIKKIKHSRLRQEPHQAVQRGFTLQLMQQTQAQLYGLSGTRLVTSAPRAPFLKALAKRCSFTSKSGLASPQNTCIELCGYRAQQQARKHQPQPIRAKTEEKGNNQFAGAASLAYSCIWLAVLMVHSACIHVAAFQTA